MWFGLVSLFPEMLSALDCGITGRAQTSDKIQIHHWNPRDFAEGARRNVDDRPYGGGPGMVMRVEPLRAAIQAAKQAAPGMPRLIYLSPQGRQFDQAAAEQFARADSLILVAGRYEGVDDRLLTLEAGESWSIGDYILSGGELAAMTIMDAVTRLVPGTLGHAASSRQESHCDGLLEHPQYTRPETVEGLAVPDVLLKGDHEAIARWRLKAALGRTFQLRPDLLAHRPLSRQEQTLLDEFLTEQEGNTREHSGQGTEQDSPHKRAT